MDSVLDDCQAGFRAGKRTAEQVTNLRILCEKNIEHGSKLVLNFVDYKKAFDRVWHDAIWAVLRKYGIDEDIMRELEQLNVKSTNKVRVGAKFSEKFPCSVGAGETRVCFVAKSFQCLSGGDCKQKS